MASKRIKLGVLFLLVVSAMSAVAWPGIGIAGSSPSTTAGAQPSGGDRRRLSPTMDRIKSSGVLRACIDPEFPPEVYLDKQGKPAGLDVALFKLMATALNAKVQFVQSNFDGLIAGLEANKCDTASAMTPRAARALAVSFAKPWEVAVVGVVVKKTETRTTIKALNNKGVKFCDQTGTGSQIDQEKYFPKASRVLLPSNDQCLLQLLSEKANAVVADNVTGEGWKAAHPQLKIVSHKVAASHRLQKAQRSSSATLDSPPGSMSGAVN